MGPTTKTDAPREAPIDLRAEATALANDFTNYAEEQERFAETLVADLGDLPEVRQAADRYREGAAFMYQTAALLDLLAAEVV